MPLVIISFLSCTYFPLYYFFLWANSSYKTDSMAEADNALPEEWTVGLLWLACMSLWVPSVIYIYSILYIFSFTIFILFINKPVITKKKQWLRQTTNFLKNGLVVYFDWHVCHCGCLQLFTSILYIFSFTIFIYKSIYNIFKGRDPW